MVERFIYLFCFYPFMEQENLILNKSDIDDKKYLQIFDRLKRNIGTIKRPITPEESHKIRKEAYKELAKQKNWTD